MKKTSLLLISIFISLTFLNAAAAPGKIIGGINHDVPSWFKLSFLDISEDAAEAQANNKHLMIFLDLDGCPYCAEMLEKSFFAKNSTSDFIKAHFDAIHIRLGGSKELTWDDNTIITEDEFAKKMEVYFTPSILFLDGDKNIVARSDGYRSPENFLDILKYVNDKSYTKMQIEDYLEGVKNKNLYQLKPNKLFSNITDLSKITTPLMVILEDGSCTQCEYLHNVTLENKDMKHELKAYTIVRLDASSDLPIIDISANKTTPKELALRMKLAYRPAILLYNEKKLKLTIDALLYSFHLKERLRYVSGKYYEKYDTYEKYSHIRKEELLKDGITIDLSQ